jgi:ADP-heptose:LPS heptosyltransferase
MSGAPTDVLAVKPRILILSTSGLARLVPALGALGGIRAYHRDAEIILLTARTTSAFATTAPYFDQVWIDETDGECNMRKLWELRARLNAAAFERIYDLDDTPHSRRLFWLMFGRRALPFNRRQIPWSGGVPGTVLSHDDPRRAPCIWSTAGRRS